MSQEKYSRKRLFVDRKLQGTLAVRVVLYWLMCLLTITLMLLCWRIVTGPARMFYTYFDDMWSFYGPALVASLLLLPMVVLDLVRLSNRFAGPVLRLRRAMRELARGEHVEPIKFRDADFWQDFATDFNVVAALVERHRSEDASDSLEPVGAGAENHL
jgi:hypothetical protein